MMEDKYSQYVRKIEENVENLKKENVQLALDRMEVVKQYDDRCDQLLFCSQIKVKLESDKLYTLIKHKMDVTSRDHEIKRLGYELELQRNAASKVEQSLVMSKNQIKAMGKTIDRLRTKKGKIESGIKTCGVCGKEFSDQENFNWSCRIHQSEYSGEMWWCCGKLDKYDPGCKSNKHIVSN